MGDSIFSNEENKATVLLSAVAILLAAALAITCMELYQTKTEAEALTQENRELLAALGKERDKANESRRVLNLETETVNVREAVYVPKENEDTDVEVNSSSSIHVSINGKTAAIKPDIREESKFQNGKLVVTESSEMNIKIDAPVQTKWTGTYLYSLKDNKHGIGLGYAIGKDLRLDAMYIADRAYLGITFPIGSMRSKKK